MSNLTEGYLVFTIAGADDNWGRGGSIEVHRLLSEFAEGNGWKMGQSPPISGTGMGVTWTCANDTDISNNKQNCRFAWNGGDYNASVISRYVHTNNMSGIVVYNITKDLKTLSVNAKSVGYTLFKTGTSNNGNVTYYSKEGAQSVGNMDYAPKLVLTMKP